METAWSQSSAGRRGAASAALLAILSVVLLFGYQSEQAHAEKFGFCPGNSGPVAPGARCVSALKLAHTYIQVHVFPPPDGQSGEICVGAKQFADGSGGNTTAFGCRLTTQGEGSQSWITFTDPPGSSPKGYATAINKASGSNYLFGLAYYTP